MGKTMSEKILSKASGCSISVGDFLWAKVHAVSLLDSSNFSSWISFFERNNLKVWDPNRIIISFDHLYRDLGSGIGSFPMIRSWARKQGIPAENLFDIGRHGISHQIPAEHGWVSPGTVYVAADTQGSTVGAFNCFAVAVLDAVRFVMATGDTWLKAPECIKIVLQGTLPKGILGKDIYFRLMKDLSGIAEGRVLEFAGPGVQSLPMDVRMAVANGAPHLGALTMIFPPDRKLTDYLEHRARQRFEVVEADSDAHYAATYEYDLGKFETLVSGPDDPGKVRPLSELVGTAVHAAYIGSCSSGRIEDLTLAAEVLKGRKIHPGVRLVVTPISSNVMQQAADQGLLATFMQAGATITTPGCGACFYGNQSPLLLDAGEVCITGSVENWPGRMGSDKAKIYLANAAVVAASALEGRIANPDRYYATRINRDLGGQT